MLVTAKMDRYLRVSGTCFFLAVSKSYDEVVVREIHGLGHEVGYHYENMDVAGREYVGWPVRWIPIELLSMYGDLVIIGLILSKFCNFIQNF